MSTPVPRTGRKRWRSRKDRSGGSNGVSGASRILPHHYADEGDKGPWFRRIVRRRETQAWKREAESE